MDAWIYVDVCLCMSLYVHVGPMCVMDVIYDMSAGQYYLLLAMDMTKVKGPLLVVKVCMCKNRLSVSRWPLSVVKVFTQI